MSFALATLECSFLLHTIDLVGGNCIENNVDGDCYDNWTIDVYELSDPAVVVATDRTSFVANVCIELVRNQLECTEKECNNCEE